MRQYYANMLHAIRGEDIHGPQALDYAVDTAIAQAAYASARAAREIDLQSDEWRIE